MRTNVFGSNVERMPRFFNWESAGTKMAEYISNHPQEFETMTTHSGEDLPSISLATVVEMIKSLEEKSK